MSEKAPLVPASDPVVRAQRCSRGRSVSKLLITAAAVGTLYYGIPWVGHSEHSIDNKAELCLTPACVHAASELLYNLSPNYKELDPCDNFEELVCGGWRDRHDLRSDQGDAFTGTIMSEQSQLLLRHILEAPYPKKSEHSYFSPMQLVAGKKSADEQNFLKMKTAYDACLDEEKIATVGEKPLLNVLKEVKQAHAHSLKDAILLLAQYGTSGLVSVGTGADDTDPDAVVVSVSAPYSFGLPSKERYEDDKLVEKYRGVAVEVLSALYTDAKQETFAKIIDLEKQLAAASPASEDRDDVTQYYNPMLIDEADAIAPEIELKALISGLAPTGADFGRVIVMAPQYLKELSVILAATDKEVVQAYFLWKVVQSLSSYVEADALKPYKRFRNTLAGKDPDSAPERWRSCVAHVDDSLGWILSRFFVEKAFSAEAKKFGDEIVTDIKTEFTKKLKSAKWMDNKTTEKAIEKVRNIVQKIGYPTKSPDIMDPSKLHGYYKSVKITPSFFDNHLWTNKLAVRYEWDALGKPVDRDQWGMTVPTVNAYYNPPGQEIVFPAGIMQRPVFDVEAPAYMSYGAFGSVAGHELSHAFDSTGRHYDQTGNYTDWWSKSTVEAFKEKAECFVKQYGNYSVPGPDDKPLHVNGRLTLGENIADAGGLSASFQAWKRRAAEKPNKDLPGLEHFTHDQLFFVTYSNWWCGKSRKDTAINRIYTDPHAPKWARILGTMANSREFRESFQCQVKEPTCQLW
ncbi:peptidase family M13 [Phaeosphaeria sp. MPI-PUGE-AT-0046c]|nr:peptidase family M13 [Phaeosphaeria sp. MPI-PUGE-AT-0046c]